MEARITYLRNTRIIHLSDSFNETVLVKNSRNQSELLTVEKKIVNLSNILGYKPHKIELFEGNTHKKVFEQINEENKPYKIAAKKRDNKEEIKRFKQETKTQKFYSITKKSF